MESPLHAMDLEITLQVGPEIGPRQEAQPDDDGAGDQQGRRRPAVVPSASPGPTRSAQSSPDEPSQDSRRPDSSPNMVEPLPRKDVVFARRALPEEGPRDERVMTEHRRRAATVQDGSGKAARSNESFSSSFSLMVPPSAVTGLIPYSDIRSVPPPPQPQAVAEDDQLGVDPVGDG